MRGDTMNKVDRSKDNFVPMKAFGSHVKVQKLDVDGKVLSVQDLHNTYTYSFVKRVLATLVQATAEDHLDATGWAKNVAISTGVYPTTPQDSDIANVVTYQELSTIADIIETAAKFSAPRSVSWKNTTGVPVIVTYLALTYGSSVAKDQVFSLVELDTSETVNDGQTLVINYDCEVTKDTSYWAPVT